MRFNYILLTLFLSLSVFAQTGTYLKPPALIEGFTTTASSAGTLTLTRASQTKQIITGVTTHTVVMPDATTMTTELGRRFFVINKSSGTVTVNASGGGLLGTILGGAQAEVHLRAAGSAAGTWDLLSSSAGGGGTWGSITGTLSAQTDLQSALDLKAPLASPTFTGTITTPLTASRAVVTGASSELAASAVTATQLGYLGTATSDLQVQLDAKQARSTLTTAGDIYVATASATTTRLGPPALDGRQLVSDSAATNKIRYKAPMVDNFIKNGDAESVTPITTYADAAATRPVDGTGGSPNVTTAISSSSPMFDVNSFTLVKDAANRQGQGWAIPFTIPAGQQAKVLQIEVPYIVSSGTFVAGTPTTDSDVIWYIYDVTNSALIEPSSIKMLSTSTTLSDKLIANFQTSATGTSYRLIAHVATTSASAYTLKIDDIIVKPSQYTYGTPITDWVSWTPTGSWVSNVTYNGQKRRVGSDGEYRVRLSITGTPTSANLTINLPSGEVIDTNKLVDVAANTDFSFGQVNMLDTGTANFIGGLSYNNTTSLQVRALDAATTYVKDVGAVTQAVPATWVNGDFITMQFRAPIVGWSSSTQMSDSFNASEISFSANTSTTAGGTGTPLIYTVVDTNKGGAYSTSTGRFTTPTSGTYCFGAGNYFAGTTTPGIYKNGTLVADGMQATASTVGRVQHCLSLVSGDLVDSRPNSPATATGDPSQNTFWGFKIGSPTTISATETIAAGYSISGDKTPAGNAAIDFDTKLWDTHNAVTTGGSGAWRFTAPAQGIYQMCVSVYTGSGGQTVDVYKNGAQGKVLGPVNSTSVNSHCTSVSLVAGDYISANPDGSVTLTGAKNNNVYITRMK